MKVLVVPEDPTYDQYILKPIVDRDGDSEGRSATKDPRIAKLPKGRGLAWRVLANI